MNHKVWEHSDTNMSMSTEKQEYDNFKGTYCLAVFQAVWHIADTHVELYIYVCIFFLFLQFLAASQLCKYNVI